MFLRFLLDTLCSARVCCFLSPRLLPLRRPHSFPTRRSSDLRLAGSAAGAGGGAAGPDPVRDRLAGRDRHPAQQDRKSTRLNSSHLGISYAVFCLKKKKENTTDTLAHTVKEIAEDCHAEDNPR